MAENQPDEVFNFKKHDTEFRNDGMVRGYLHEGKTLLWGTAACIPTVATGYELLAITEGYSHEKVAGAMISLALTGFFGSRVLFHYRESEFARKL